jgi:hypothetical protein
MFMLSANKRLWQLTQSNHKKVGSKVIKKRELTNAALS